MADNSAVVLPSLPNSIEAEQNVLCCILRNASIQLDIISELEPEDFYQTNHRIIFDAMKEIARKTHKVDNEYRSNTVSFATVVDALRRNGKLQQVGDVEYIARLNDILPGTARFEEYVSIVKRASLLRALINVCGDITAKCYQSDSTEDLLSFAESKIFNLSQKGTSSGLVDLSGLVARTVANISERYSNPSKFYGLATGFKQFDRMTNGLHGGELIVLAARPGVGKSAMAMNIVQNVAENGGTVAVFSLEMSNEQLIERMLSAMSGIPLEFLKSGQLPHGDGDIVKLQTANSVISSKMHIYGNDNANVKPPDISSQCRRLKAQSGLDLIVIDYIQLMNTEKKAEGRQQEVANITRSLKLLAKELNVPVIALSQLKRDAEIRNIKKGEGSGKPVLSDLRESGAIEQDADIVLFIHRDDPDDRQSEDVTLIVAKHRNGQNGEIPLRWVGKLVRFVDRDYLVEQPALNKSAEQRHEEDVPPEGAVGDSEESFMVSDIDDMTEEELDKFIAEQQE